MKQILTAIALSALLCTGACKAKTDTTAETPQPTPAESLAARLRAVQSSGKTLFGHHDDPVYGHTWVGDTGRSDILETVGEYPAVMSWDLGRLELGDSLNLDGVPFGRMRSEIIAQHARGGINTFSWHLFSPRDTAADSWAIGDSLTVSEILDNPEVNAAFRSQMSRLAEFFNSLTDADGQRIPVIFRPWHENTGFWFWWGAPYCTPDQYRRLWQLPVDELRRAGVDNVLYAYSPVRVDTPEQFMERYPGDSIVDIVGADIYHFNGADGLEDFRNTASRVLAIVNDIAREHGKIAAFTETGSESLPLDNWWTDALLPIIRANRPAYVVIWRNAHDKPGHFFAPYPGQASEPDFRTFHADTTILFIPSGKE